MISCFFFISTLNLFVALGLLHALTLLRFFEERGGEGVAVFDQNRLHFHYITLTTKISQSSIINKINITITFCLLSKFPSRFIAKFNVKFPIMQFIQLCFVKATQAARHLDGNWQITFICFLSVLKPINKVLDENFWYLRSNTHN